MSVQRGLWVSFVGALLLATHASTGAESDATLRNAAATAATPMTLAAYQEYLRRFNAGDDRYAELYDENVVFDHGPFYGVLRGRRAILDFYRDVRTQMKETVTADAVVIDNERRMMAAELTTELRAIRDGVKLASRTINTGDVYTSRGTAIYEFNAEGKITFIRAAKQGSSFEPAKP